MQRLFVTNRPNYCHRKFAEAVGCDFYHVKHLIPENVPLLALTVNGVVNARSLPESDTYFAESIMDYYPVHYRNYGKKIILIAEDTLYKLDKMIGFKKYYIIRLLRSADGFIAISDLCKSLIVKYTKKPVKVTYPFPHREFFHVNARQNGKNIIFIGRNDPTKGFHELAEAVRMLRMRDKDWTLTLLGECSRSIKKEEGINPLGFVKDMSRYLSRSTYLVHPAAFDPCPATVFEAMNAGVIPVISKNIGQSEIFRKNKLDDLVLESITPESIASKLVQLSQRSTSSTSKKLKKISTEFTEKKRTKMFLSEFENLEGEI